jgi:hypothetical protein
MGTATGKTCIAFAGSERIASGNVREVAAAVKAACDASGSTTVLVFDAGSNRPVELDLRGSVEDVLGRLEETTPTPGPDAESPRKPGRPKLGVVAREVTLLPRHWEWLSTQPGGASATLRRLVDTARKGSGGADEARRSQESAYRFMTVMAGDEPGYEDAVRALFAGDRERFIATTESWPRDVRDHARESAERAFPA